MVGLAAGMTPEGWSVPGAAFNDGSRIVRLCVPEAWKRVVLDLPRTPPSMNTNVGRGHWRAFQSEKKEWQEEIETLLMIEKVKRGGYQRAAAGAFLRFNIRRKQRDPSNFATVVNKALGDALVNYGAIDDDDAPHYVFGGVEFEEEQGPPRTRILVYLQPTED